MDTRIFLSDHPYLHQARDDLCLTISPQWVGNVEERDGVTDKFAKVTHHLYDISLDYGGLNVNRCSIEK